MEFQQARLRVKQCFLRSEPVEGHNSYYKQSRGSSRHCAGGGQPIARNVPPLTSRPLTHGAEEISVVTPP